MGITHIYFLLVQYKSQEWQWRKVGLKLTAVLPLWGPSVAGILLNSTAKEPNYFELNAILLFKKKICGK